MNQHKLKIIILVLAMLSTCLIFAFGITLKYYFLPLTCSIFLAIELYFLFRLIDQQNRTFKKFIWSVKYGDFTLSTTSSGKQDAIEPEIEELMQTALQEFKNKLHTKESQYQYFYALAQYMDIAVIVYTPSGQIEWMNRAAQKEVGNIKPNTIDDLVVFHPELPARLRSLTPSEISILPFLGQKGKRHLALSGITFTVNGKRATAVSLKNVHTLLENKESEAWQKLIRVLTHEIMNSLTPILSLSSYLKEMDKENSLSGEEVSQTLETIHRRSKYLSKFVQNYRKVTGIPSPDFHEVDLNKLLSHIVQLLSPSTPGLYYTSLPYPLQVLADRSQIEQVIINLIKNAADATQETLNPVITLFAGTDQAGRIIIEVKDNGKGVDPEIADRIFVPFYTTKPTGSGLGLSISRQIMLMHHGSLSLHTDKFGETSFLLTF